MDDGFLGGLVTTALRWGQGKLRFCGRSSFVFAVVVTVGVIFFAVF